MRLHHKGGYTPEERDSYREIVYANLVPSRLLSPALLLLIVLFLDSIDASSNRGFT